MTSKEHRRSPRHTPASQVSVMLYRDNARPRGCYVGNYSKHGVILKCSALETDIGAALKVGDEVSLHFWDRGEPGHSIRVSGRIVRFDENQVAIEYASTSSASLERLLNLLDQRADQPLSADEDSTKDLPKLRLPDKPRPKRAPDEAEEATDRSAAQPISPEARVNAPRSGLMLGLLIAAVLGVVGLGLYSLTLHNQIDELSNTVSVLAMQEPNQDPAASVADLTQSIVAIEDLTQRIVVMEEKQQDLSTSLSEMVKQSDFQAAVEELNAQLQLLASQQKAASTTAKKIQEQKAAPTTAKKIQDTQPKARVSTEQQSWVVHLAALSDEGAVDKFVSKAKSLGIDVQKEQITVNEKQMYRLSISGLASYDEAEKLANDVQKKLALKQKPWIAKR